MTRASLDALHDHDLPDDTMSFETTIGVAWHVEVRGGDLLMRRHDLVLVVETASEKQVTATQIETFPRVIRLAVPRHLLMELPVAPAQATTVETSEETLVTEPIFVVLGDDPEAVVVGEMIVAIGVEKQSAIIGVHERKEHRRSVTNGAVIEIDGNGMRLSEDAANHHPLGEVAHQAIALASPFGRLQQAKI